VFVLITSPLKLSNSDQFVNGRMLSVFVISVIVEMVTWSSSNDHSFNYKHPLNQRAIPTPSIDRNRVYLDHI